MASIRPSFRLLFAAGIAITIAGKAVTARAADPSKPATARYVAQEIGWSLKLPAEENVVFQGVANFDSAGVGMGPILYPAPNLAGFFAALLTHSVILESTRSAQKNRMQEEADRVLTPYKAVLAEFKHHELMQKALERTTTSGNKQLVESTAKPGAGLHIESVPLFSMTQDQRAIILDNAFLIFAPGAPSAPAYKNIIRVVSQPETGRDPVPYWNENAGAALKNESIRLLADSLDLVLADIAAKFPQDGPQRTVRYLEGRTEKMERGQILQEQCGRVVLKNLRGWIMSVAAKPMSPEVVAACGDKAPKPAPAPDLAPPQQAPADDPASEQKPGVA